MTNNLRRLSGNRAENVLIRDCQYVFYWMELIYDAQILKLLIFQNTLVTLDFFST